MLSTIAAAFAVQACAPSRAMLSDDQAGTQLSTDPTPVVPALRITPTAATVSPLGAYPFTATGGAGALSFFIASGGGSIDSLTGAFVAPGTAGTVRVGVRDEASHTTYALVTVTGSPADNTDDDGAPAADLALSPSSATVNANGSVRFAASGGRGTYAYSVVSGGGAFQGSTYVAAASAGSAVVQVRDDAGQTRIAVVTIRPSNAGTVVERTLAIWADHHIGVTFDGTDPAHATFSFFGTSSAISAGTIGWNGGYCAKNPYGMVIAPCADGVELTNFDARSGNVYRGNLVLQGRNGTAQLDFCIDPARPTRALVRNLTSNLFSRSVAYNQDGKLLLNGRANVGQYAALDTSSGAGWVNVQVRGSGHTSETSCGFGYSDAAYMEVAY